MPTCSGSGLRYLCDQCEYSATQLKHLKGHKEAKHHGINLSLLQQFFCILFLYFFLLSWMQFLLTLVPSHWLALSLSVRDNQEGARNSRLRGNRCFTLFIYILCAQLILELTTYETWDYLITFNKIFWSHLSSTKMYFSQYY